MANQRFSARHVARYICHQIATTVARGLLMRPFSAPCNTGQAEARRTRHMRTGMMDKVREALEEKLGAARKRLTDLTISEIMDTSLVDAFDLAADAAREALSALQEAGEAKVRYAGWSPDKRSEEHTSELQSREK